MSRIRTPLLVLGLLGAVAVAVVVFVVIRVERGTAVDLPVAIGDIEPGALVEPQQFRLTQVRGLDAQTLAAYVTVDEFSRYIGYPLLEGIHAGFPLGKAQVRTNDPNLLQGRLTLLLSDPTHLVYPLPVTPDQAGNYLFAGDRVDVIFTLGRVATQELTHAEEDDEAFRVTSPTTGISGTVQTMGWTRALTTTFQLPVSKVVLTDVLVLRVERERIRATSASYGMGDGETSGRTVEGDVLRVYLEVDREQAELLSFALHNGALNLPARATPAGSGSTGMTWDDFEEWFFHGRQMMSRER